MAWVRSAYLIGSIGAGALISVASLSSMDVIQFASPVTFSRESTTTPAVVREEKVSHQEMPDAVKAVYMSQCAASSNAFRTSLFSLADTTEINSIVVDLKDYSGTVAFPSKYAIPGGKGCTVSDFKELVSMMHEKGIYVIGRLTVFQDPLYTTAYPERAVQRKSGGVWKDNKGLAFVDVGAKEFWDYTVALARESHMLGVDEINFDYIRFPSDGPMAEALYTKSTGSKQEQVEAFWKYLHDNFKKEEGGHVPIMSADLFGMTTTNTDDLNIGQVLERALPHFDYIAPMVYPSHYPPNFNGWKNPNEHVYGVIHHSMTEAVRRVERATTTVPCGECIRIGTTTPALYEKPTYSRLVLRPWLQDFDYGGDYGPKEVRDQIQATYDAGLTSWMLWAPSNKYTKEALLEK